MRAFALAATALACTVSAVAQPPAPPAPASAAPEPAPAARKRPTVAVMDFDYGALTTHWWGQYDIGRGVATQLVNALVDDDRLRLIERSKLDAVLGEQDFAASDRASPEAKKLAKVGKVLGVRYIVAGSITKFATSDRKFGGGTAGAVARTVMGPVGGLSFRKAKQEVTVTARLIDTTTGEVVASATGEGVAKKGQGVALEMGAPGGTGFSTESPEFRASGMGEAQEMAVTQLARGLLAHVGELSVEVPKPDPPPPPPPSPAKARPARKPPAAKPAVGSGR